MNIEEFYAANEVRRDSTEFEFGNEWSDNQGNRYELSWVEVTGELYLMADPSARVSEDPLFGDALGYYEPIGALSVIVIATIATHEQVEAALLGWADEMGNANSVGWLGSRFPRPEARSPSTPSG